jgi:hypothetical protein
MTTCADVTDCLLFRHLALFLGGVGIILIVTKMILVLNKSVGTGMLKTIPVWHNIVIRKLFQSNMTSRRSMIF